MRGGRRAGRSDRLAHDLARHRARAEGADRPPGVQRLQGRFAEEVVGGRADELRGQSIPRTTAAGTRSALPITMPAAAAIWSASAMTVTSSSRPA